MRTVENPSKDMWESLCVRPYIDRLSLDDTVLGIVEEVRQFGDKALYSLTERIDGVRLDSLLVTKDEIRDAIGLVDGELKSAISRAIKNIELFHRAQTPAPCAPVEMIPGLRCWTKEVAIESVGLYIPGGSAPLFSTVYMLGVPAKLAGCREIVLCTPPNKEGGIDSTLLFTASLLGIEKIVKVGGAQAISALAYGTKSVPRVDKIFGPGNQYVSAAKRLVSKDCDYDFDAGPSEVLVIADRSATPANVASDLLAQAEHGEDSQVILLTDCLEFAQIVSQVATKGLDDLPRGDIASRSLANALSIYLPTLNECVEFSNKYAPEHLIIYTTNPDSVLDGISSAGSIFVRCPEVLGDYFAGPNHCLPTGGKARSSSGLTVSDFRKRITVTSASREALEAVATDLGTLARAEGLEGHARAAFNSLDTE